MYAEAWPSVLMSSGFTPVWSATGRFFFSRKDVAATSWRRWSLMGAWRGSGVNEGATPRGWSRVILASKVLAWRSRAVSEALDTFFKNSLQTVAVMEAWS